MIPPDLLNHPQLAISPDGSLFAVSFPESKTMIVCDTVQGCEYEPSCDSENTSPLRVLDDEFPLDQGMFWTPDGLRLVGMGNSYVLVHSYDQCLLL